MKIVILEEALLPMFSDYLIRVTSNNVEIGGSVGLEFAPGNPGTREFPGIPTYFQSRRPGNFVAGIPGKI